MFTNNLTIAQHQHNYYTLYTVISVRVLSPVLLRSCFPSTQNDLSFSQKDNILDYSKLGEFTDDKEIIAEMKLLVKVKKKTCGKRKNVGHQHFLFVLNFFQMLCPQAR